MKKPTPDDIFGARLNAKHTQKQAAELIGISKRTWQDGERGVSRMAPANYRLYLILTGQERFPVR